MAVSHSPLAPEHLPFFITAPGETDVLFHITAWFVLLSIVGLGVVFFTIHSLPERMAHRTKKVQLDIVAVLCLLALLTHEHVFWFAALLLAFIDLPDFLTPVMRIATAVERISGEQTPSAPGAEAEESSPVEAEGPPGETGTPAQTDAPRKIKKGASHA
jgi:hypothetical protein